MVGFASFPGWEIWRLVLDWIDGYPNRVYAKVVFVGIM